MLSMTYGHLPNREVFDAHFIKHCPDGIYSVRNDHVRGDVDYTSISLYTQISTAIETGDEEALDFASVALYSLGIEWI